MFFSHIQRHHRRGHGDKRYPRVGEHGGPQRCGADGAEDHHQKFNAYGQRNVEGHNGPDPARDADGAYERGEAGGGEDGIGAFHSEVGAARAYGYAHGCGGERGSVVDAVADKNDALSATDGITNRLVLVVGAETGAEGVGADS